MNDERKRSGRIALAVCLLGACFWCAADRQPLAGEMAYHARPCCRPNHHLHTGCRSSRHHQPGKCEHPTRLPGIPSQHTDTFRLRIEQGALTLDPNWVSRYNPYNTGQARMKNRLHLWLRMAASFIQPTLFFPLQTPPNAARPNQRLPLARLWGVQSIWQFMAELSPPLLHAETWSASISLNL